MKNLILFFSLIMISCVQKPKYNYGLEVSDDVNSYKNSLQEHPEYELVDLENIENIQLDIRYATTNNFTGEVIYNLPKAYARKPVAEALAKVQKDLNAMGYGLKIFDGYRPYRATVKFYEVYGDTTFVASPYRGSRHNRGCAIDLTVIDLSTGEELKMPTPYDDFTELAFAEAPVQDSLIRANRALLKTSMEEHGFTVYTHEWWHFDFNDWESFPLLDIPFEDL